MVMNIDANWGGSETRQRNATCLLGAWTRIFGQGYAAGVVLHTNNPARAGQTLSLDEPLALAGGDLLIIALGPRPPPAPATSPPFKLGVDMALLGAGLGLCLLAFFKSRRPNKRKALDELHGGEVATSPKLLLFAFTIVNLMTYVDRGFLSVPSSCSPLHACCFWPFASVAYACLRGPLCSGTACI